MKNSAPPGRFPEGKLNKDDQGELRIAIGHAKGNVIIRFGKHVDWLGLPPANARALCAVILEHAEALEKERG